MQALKEAILQYGTAIAPDIVKVDMFLNHRIDTKLTRAIGQALADYFRSEKPDVILTVESSGIAISMMTAQALDDLPVVFAKKSVTVVQNGNVAQAPVYSFTHKSQNVIRIDKKYIPAGSKVLIIDDFLADGQAVEGMMMLCQQVEAEVIGVGIAIEKGFMPGGRRLREKNINLKSLAIVQSVKNGGLTLKDD